MNTTTLIAYEMNGEPLPDRQGAPARMLMPGYFGEKNVKVGRAHRDRAGRRERLLRATRLGPDFIIPIRSRIDFLEDRMQQPLDEAANGVPLKGIAFAGDRGVARFFRSLAGAMR